MAGIGIACNLEITDQESQCLAVASRFMKMAKPECQYSGKINLRYFVSISGMPFHLKRYMYVA